jgi:AraC-like DNA-binding protein
VGDCGVCAWGADAGCDRVAAPSGRPLAAAVSSLAASVGVDSVSARRVPSPARHHREDTCQSLAELYVHASAVTARHYRRALTLPLVARSLACSPRQLQRAYDEIGLTSFAAELRTARLRNAAELLAHQPLTVTDVARLVGYRQPSHFVKAFRHRYGVTPAVFRARHQERRRADPGYSMPNSAAALPPEAEDEPPLDELDEPDDGAPEPTLAERAVGGGEGDGVDGDPLPPAPPPSKPNSELA